MPPSPVVVLVPMAVAARPMASLALAPSAPKLMPAMVMGILSSIGFLAKRVPRCHISGAFLAIALQGIARDGGAKENEIVEGGQLALGAIAADFIEALIRGAMDLRQDVGREAVRRTQAPGIDGHLWSLLDPQR